MRAAGEAARPCPPARARAVSDPCARASREHLDHRLAEFRRPGAMVLAPASAMSASMRRRGRSAPSSASRGAARSISTRRGLSAAGDAGLKHSSRRPPALRLRSIASQIAAATSGPPVRLMARMPVGEVTLISVRKPSITSMPTKIRPRFFSSGPMVAQISFSRGESSVASAAPPRTMLERMSFAAGTRLTAPHGCAIDENDALVAAADSGQEFLHHPLLAETGGEQIEQRAVIGVLRQQPEHGRAAMAVQRLHHHFAMLARGRRRWRPCRG